MVVITNCTGKPLEPGAVGTGTQILGARDLRPFLLQVELQLMRVAGALVPGLEEHAADALIDGGNARNLKHLLVFGLLLGDLKHLVRVGLHLLRGRIGRAVDFREYDALVLLRRQFRLGEFEARHEHQQQQAAPSRP